ncbi:hypothetical protein PR202_ga11597 [Eleusine coracana subsp. coracana]|uniref:Uncharacterized protein n=1 Tax=Eleusine coracana subsp. coracana TaxID=191504 RepID=A0AAV5C9R5_ELECO|nr:hypothetical protein PR202_ga11597 [Eleusine coracana subsp. coracana]
MGPTEACAPPDDARRRPPHTGSIHASTRSGISRPDLATYASDPPTPEHPSLGESPFSLCTTGGGGEGTVEPVRCRGRSLSSCRRQGSARACAPPGIYTCAAGASARACARSGDLPMRRHRRSQPPPGGGVEITAGGAAP